MRIPVIYADEPTQVTLANAGQGWRARGAAADEAGNLMASISQHQAALKEKERIAQINLKSIEYENNVKKDMLELEGFLENDTDHETMVNRYDKMVSDIETKHAPKNPSPELNLKTKSTFSGIKNRLRDKVNSTKYKVMDSKGKAAYLTAEQLALDAIVETNDPAERNAIKKKLEATKDSLTSVSDPLWLHSQFTGFEEKIKTKEIEYQEVQAMVAMDVNPDKFLEDIKNPNYLSKLEGKKRQQMIERVKTIKNQKEAEVKELKAATDHEVGVTVSEYIRDGKFSEALTFIDKTNLIDESEKLQLETRVKTASKVSKNAALDPAVDARILLKIQNPTANRTEIRQDLATALLLGQISVESARTHYGDIDDPIFQEPYFKDMTSMYRENLGWSSQSEQFMHPSGAAAYRTAVYQLQNRIKNEGLKGDAIRKAGVEIAIPLLRDFWVNGKFMSQVEAAKNIRVLAESVGLKVEKHSPNPDKEDVKTTDGKVRPTLESYSN